MPFKDSAQRRSYQKKYHEGWYATNGDHRRQQVKDRRRALRIRFRAYKESLCCHNCGLDGKDNSWALDFHHVCEPEEKISTIAHLVSSGYSWDKIMSEIDKCVVVCAANHNDYIGGRVSLYYGQKSQTQINTTFVCVYPTRDRQSIR